MTTAQGGDESVHRWVKHARGPMHTPVVVTGAWAVLCLLVAQRDTPAALARALPAQQAGSGRSGGRRVRRWGNGPALAQATIRAALLRRALPRLAADQPVGVALDTTRLGRWAVWLAGIGGAGRIWPIGWAVLPSPWPKGRLRATTLRPCRPRCAGRWGRTVVVPAQRFLRRGARVARTAACGCG
jgi:hypothetical protein